MPSITLVLTRLPTSCTASTSKEKRVSIRLVSIDSLVYTSFFFFCKCFLLVEITTKLNKDIYAKMRSKKDKPLSSIGKKGVHVTGKGSSVTPVTSTTPIVFDVETVRTASPTTSVEEILTPSSKRPRLSVKNKEKADSRSSIA